MRNPEISSLKNKNKKKRICLISHYTLICSEFEDQKRNMKKSCTNVN